MAECGGSDQFLDVVEQCTAKEFVVVILSAAAIPAAWPRPVWERVLIEGVRESGVQMAYVMLDDCPFPLMLRRRNFFDFRVDQRGGMRKLRQWLVQAPEMERLAPEVTGEGSPDERFNWLLDKPGLVSGVSRAAAVWMVRNWWRDFEDVCWVQCAHLGAAGVLGETAQQMRLRLPGTFEANWLQLREHAVRQRTLFVFEHLSNDTTPWGNLGGRSSVVLVAGEAPERLPFEQIKEMFSRKAMDEEACIRAWSSLLTEPEQVGSWPEILSIGRLALRLLKQRARLAEVHEGLAWLADVAKQQRDARALESIRWEEHWILNEWSLSGPERDQLTRTLPVQLALPLAGFETISSETPVG
jgi:hypothetical protein